jgi:hypothetical protein
MALSDKSKDLLKKKPKSSGPKAVEKISPTGGYDPRADYPAMGAYQPYQPPPMAAPQPQPIPAPSKDSAAIAYQKYMMDKEMRGPVNAPTGSFKMPMPEQPTAPPNAGPPLTADSSFTPGMPVNAGPMQMPKQDTFGPSDFGYTNDMMTGDPIKAGGGGPNSLGAVPANMAALPQTFKYQPPAPMAPPPAYHTSVVNPGFDPATDQFTEEALAARGYAPSPVQPYSMQPPGALASKAMQKSKKK